MKNPAVGLYRIGNFSYRNKLTLIAKAITWLNRFLFSVFIPSSATIGANFKLGS